MRDTHDDQDHQQSDEIGGRQKTASEEEGDGEADAGAETKTWSNAEPKLKKTNRAVMNQDQPKEHQGDEDNERHQQQEETSDETWTNTRTKINETSKARHIAYDEEH